MADLKSFMATFGESVSVLSSLNVPDLDNFILFSLASRCLPASCRTLFESQLTTDYPTDEGLFAFVKGRIDVLERVQGVSSKQSAATSSAKDRFKAPPRWQRKTNCQPQTSSVTGAPTPSSMLLCKCCNQAHTLE